MKKVTLFFSAVVVSLLLSSCGINSALVINSNQSATHVTLSSNNYKVVDRISGSAEVVYICLIGGINHKQLYANAYSDMMKKANLMNSSRAVINIVTEEHMGGVPPFYFKRTVTISANVIEFTK